MAKAKLSKWLFAATLMVGAGAYSVLAADDMLPPPPPGGDMMAPPPPGGDTMAPPPPAGDAMAPPPGGDMMAPPPGAAAPAPGGDMMAPPPGGDAMAPPPGGDMMAPPPGAPAGDALAPPPSGDMMAPPPGGDTMAPPPSGDLAPPPTDTQFKEEKKPKSEGGSATSYSVRHGDSLWKISGKSKVYGDHFQWPLLFINNKDLIKDPDIIKPEWDLKVQRNAPSDQVSSAVQKAKDTPRFSPHTTVRKHLPIEY